MSLHRNLRLSFEVELLTEEQNLVVEGREVHDEAIYPLDQVRLVGHERPEIGVHVHGRQDSCIHSANESIRFCRVLGQTIRRAEL